MKKNIEKINAIIGPLWAELSSLVRKSVTEDLTLEEDQRRAWIIRKIDRTHGYKRPKRDLEAEGQRRFHREPDGSLTDKSILLKIKNMGGAK